MPSTTTIGNGFGLTEITGVLTLLPDDEAEEYAESVGYAMPSNELKICDPESPYRDGGVARSRSERDARLLEQPGSDEGDHHRGWLHTGDIATIDDEVRVHIVDRAKDMINRGGENAYCSEVEIAFAAMAGVAEVAVVGLPNPTMGEPVAALPACREGYRSMSIV
ncbi:AMP-binding protein [Nocardia vinacea]|uniref:AMP-binding protein n=1 Tax=Nocardia vinacea TaxID=96468 RepID=UPI000689066D|nr:AMP-binding protein [Nocardia vinacea]